MATYIIGDLLTWIIAMPFHQSQSLFHATHVAQELIKLIPPNLMIHMDSDVTHFGEGVIRFSPMVNVPDDRPQRACWIGYVHGNMLMISLGDVSNFHRYKHDYITPHIDILSMDAVWLPSMTKEGAPVFNYYLAATTILMWIMFGLKLRVKQAIH